MQSMDYYPRAAMERAMKVQEVILQAMARKISWYQAAEIIGISDRHMRRWRERYEEFGFRGLFDRRRGKPSPKRVPVSGGRESSGAVSGEVFRSEPAASSPRGAPSRDQLQLGEGDFPNALGNPGKVRGIPTFSPSRRLRVINLKPDISLVK